MTAEDFQKLVKKYNIKLGIEIKFIHNLKKWQNPILETTPLPIQVKVIKPIVTKQLDMVEILNKTAQGALILKKYEEVQIINDATRSILVELIINHMIQIDLRMTIDVAKKILEAIVEVFPSECDFKVSTYVQCYVKQLFIPIFYLELLFFSNEM